jgi:16S rRNA (uracil1498-N3)-methyltransferase
VNRFYVDAELVPGEPAALSPAAAHHAARVLRLRDGALVTAFNGRGGEFDARLSVQGARAWIVPERFHPIERESPLAVTLVQGWVATDKLEWIVEKSVELGVRAMTLVPTARSVIQLDSPRRERRLLRLQDIVLAACCQCGRNRIPPIVAATSLEAGLQSAISDAGTGLLLDPYAESGRLEASQGGPIALAVGAEGGFDDTERALAATLGYRAIKLGPRILRTETAGLVGLAVLQASAGDLR